MISLNARLGQLVSERGEAQSLLNSGAKILIGQLQSVEHPILDSQQVKTVRDDALRLIELVDKLVRLVKDKDPVDVLHTDDGELFGRSIFSLYKNLDLKIDAWHDNNAAKILEIDTEEPSDQVHRQRSICFQFTALCRTAQSLTETNLSILDLHNIRVWVVDGELCFAGKEESSDGGSND